MSIFCLDYGFKVPILAVCLFCIDGGFIGSIEAYYRSVYTFCIARRFRSPIRTMLAVCTLCIDCGFIGRIRAYSCKVYTFLMTVPLKGLL